jgi:hypothetical protein
VPGAGEDADPTDEEQPAWTTAAAPGRRPPLGLGTLGARASRATPLIRWIEVANVANGRLAAEVDRIIGCRAAVSQATIDRLTQRAEGLRPWAAARARLAGLEPDLVVARPVGGPGGRREPVRGG